MQIPRGQLCVADKQNGRAMESPVTSVCAVRNLEQRRPLRFRTGDFNRFAARNHGKPLPRGNRSNARLSNELENTSIPQEGSFDGLTSQPERPYTQTIRNRAATTKIDQNDLGADRDLYSGLIRLHVLHHAVEEPIFGLGMAEELARHGYRISPGTLYPLLHSLEKKGYLRSSAKRNGKSLRKVYRATPLGREALNAAKEKIKELFREVIEGK